MDRYKTVYFAYPQADEPRWIESEEPIQYYLDQPSKYKLIGAIGSLYVFCYTTNKVDVKLFFMCEE